MVHLVAFLGEMGTVCPLENGQGAGDSIDSWKMPSDLSLAPVLEQEPGSNQKEIWRSGVGWGGGGAHALPLCGQVSAACSEMPLHSLRKR